MKRLAKLSIVLLIGTLSTTDLFAQPSVDELTESERKEVGTLLMNAKTAFDEQSYQRAIGFLERAYSTFPDPNILFRLGQCHESLGNEKLAVSYYRRYLDGSPNATDGETVKAKIERIEATFEVAESQIGTLRVTGNPREIRVTVAEVEKRTPAEYQLPPGTYDVSAQQPGFEPYQSRVDIRAGETSNLFVPLVEAAIQKNETPSKVLPWMLVGTGSAAIATSVVSLALAFDAGSKVSAYDDARNRAYVNNDPVPSRPSDYDSLIRREQSLKRVSIVTAGVGLPLATIGVIMLLTRSKSKVAISPRGVMFRTTF